LAGLDGIVFTDHHRLTSPQELRDLEQAFAPLRVWGGAEITAIEDFLVLGVDDPALESTGWQYPDLWRFVRQQGGYLVLAHPFRYAQSIRDDIEHFPPDAIELYSHNTPLSQARAILEIAQRLGCAVFSNSDAHVQMHLGRYYNQFALPAGADFDLLTALRAAPTGLFYDGQLHAYPLQLGAVYEN
jgi:predicted metal-dependent phosphoesterase TrpH